MNQDNIPLLNIYKELKEQLSQKEYATIQVENPDSVKNAISLRSWIDLAQLLFCRLHIPKMIDKNKIELTFEKLNQSNSFHIQKIKDKKEKYGVDSLFFQLDKMKQSSFLIHYLKALESVQIAKKKHILNLGINKADEFELIRNILSLEEFTAIEFTGIDHSQTAIEYAKEKFSTYNNVHFLNADITKLKSLKLKKADLIISIGTLQSPSINYKPFLMELVQEHLSSNGALILAFPNSRWIDGELIYGAKAPNYSYSEMGLLYNDVIFAKKYLQQKKFRVTITGKDYIFITARKIGN